MLTAAGGEESEEEQASALQPFPRITRAAIEALRYRAEDIARSLTKTVIKEVGSDPPSLQGYWQSSSWRQSGRGQWFSIA